MFFPVSYGFIQVTVETVDDHGFASVVQGHAGFALVEERVVHLFSCEQIDGGLFGVNPERFDENENKRLVVVVVRVQETHKRVQSRDDAGFFSPAVKDAESIVQGRIERIFGWPPRPAFKTDFFRHDGRKALKIGSSGASLEWK